MQFQVKWLMHDEMHQTWSYLCNHTSCTGSLLTESFSPLIIGVLGPLAMKWLYVIYKPDEVKTDQQTPLVVPWRPLPVRPIQESIVYIKLIYRPTVWRGSSQHNSDYNMINQRAKHFIKVESCLLMETLCEKPCFILLNWIHLNSRLL